MDNMDQRSGLQIDEGKNGGIISSFVSKATVRWVKLDPYSASYVSKLFCCIPIQSDPDPWWIARSRSTGE